VWCALIPLFLLAPSPAFPQNKQATVKVESLAVHSSMSTESDVVSTLAQGTVVRILLTVTGEEGNWCNLATQNGSSKIGYVLCSGLDRPKEPLAAAAQTGPLPQILGASSRTPAQASKRQTRGGEEGGLVGQTLDPLPGYNWSSYRKTLVIAIRRGCPYCDASMPFYRQLGEQERNNALGAHALLVMPNDPATGSRLLREHDVDVEAVFGQPLAALNVSGTPTLLLVDSGGRIQRTWVGQLPPRAEREVLNAARE
jgi:hypothetical protein